jgi:hypothetical protein
MMLPIPFLRKCRKQRSKNCRIMPYSIRETTTREKTLDDVFAIAKANILAATDEEYKLGLQLVLSSNSVGFKMTENVADSRYVGTCSRCTGCGFTTYSQADIDFTKVCGACLGFGVLELEKATSFVVSKKPPSFLGNFIRTPLRSNHTIAAQLSKDVFVNEDGSLRDLFIHDYAAGSNFMCYLIKLAEVLNLENRDLPGDEDMQEHEFPFGCMLLDWSHLDVDEIKAGFKCILGRDVKSPKVTYGSVARYSSSGEKTEQRMHGHMVKWKHNECYPSWS